MEREIGGRLGNPNVIHDTDYLGFSEMCKAGSATPGKVLRSVLAAPDFEQV
jgi:hypothetical protein